MKTLLLALPLALTATPALAHGDVACNAGPTAEWKSIESLQAKLKAEGWTVRKALRSGDCYEVYGVTPDRQRVEAFFHPVTQERVLVLRRGQVLYKAPWYKG